MNYKNLKFLFLIGITKNEGRTNIKNIAICFISVGISTQCLKNIQI